MVNSSKCARECANRMRFGSVIADDDSKLLDALHGQLELVERPRRRTSLENAELQRHRGHISATAFLNCQLLHGTRQRFHSWQRLATTRTLMIRNLPLNGGVARKVVGEGGAYELG